MKKSKVLSKFFEINQKIQDYKLKKKEDFLKDSNFSLEDKEKIEKIEKFSGASKRVLVLLLDIGEINQRNIAKNLDISAQAVSETIKKLENTELITKVTGLQNNENIIKITEEGEKVAKIFKKRINQHAKYVFQNMSDKELEELYALLAKMQVN